MAARRPSNFRPSYSRWDRREIGLKPENALSRVARKFFYLSQSEILKLEQPFFIQAIALHVR